MPLFTPEELAAEITAWKAALRATAAGQEYEHNGRRLKRSDLAEIRNTLAWLQAEQETATGAAVGRTYAANGGRG